MPKKGLITYKSLLVLLLAAIAMSCNSPYTYKKKGYFAIDFPEKKYQQFNNADYPYTFEYPTYAQISKDSVFFGDKAEDYWINIDFPRFRGRIYVSYKPVTTANFDTLVNDAFKMVHKQHDDVSTGIDDSLMKTPNGVEGIYFSLKGNTATANQFFVTDSTNHFLRGALYFDAAPNEDSLSTVNDFLRQDLKHLINTLRWK